jgi:Tfp pilus assembly protein PilV
MISMMILGIMVTGIVAGFTQSHKVAEWSAYSLAAQSVAMQALEQSRSAQWSPTRAVPVDQLVDSNFPARIHLLDVPVSGTNMTYATNRVTIRTVSTDPPVKLISVECTWRFPNRGLFTNSIFTYRSPDQ